MYCVGTGFYNIFSLNLTFPWWGLMYSYILVVDCPFRMWLMNSKVHALGEKSMGWISVCPAHFLVLRVYIQPVKGRLRAPYCLFTPLAVSIKSGNKGKEFAQIQFPV